MEKKPRRICRNGCGNPIYTNDDQLCKKCLKELKKQFDESFAKVKPKEFIKKMEKLGYKFRNIKK